MELALERIRIRIKPEAVILLLAFVVVAVAVYVMAPTQLYALDWEEYFKPATLLLLHGVSPYTLEGFYNPPWTLIPLIPFAVMPDRIGYALLISTMLSTMIGMAYLLRKDLLCMVLFILLPQTFDMLIFANLEWLVLIGCFLPPQIGLFFVVMKPQIGIGVVLYWLVSSYRKGGIREIIRVFAPVGVVTALSTMLYGLWPLHMFTHIGYPHSADLWPASMLVGIPLLLYALFKKNNKQDRGLWMGLMASPMLSPFLIWHSWIAVPMGSMKLNKKLFIALFVLSWLVVAVSAYMQWR